MTDVPRSIVLHVGAHKTATTHLQHSLHGARRLLVRNGIRFFGPMDLRQLGQRLEARFNLPFNPRKSVADLRPAPDVLAEMMGDGTRLVVSEENFIGTLFDKRYPGPLHNLPQPLYSDAQARLAALTGAIAPQGGIEVCIGLRDPAGFLNSAYGLVMQAGSTVPLDRFKRRNPVPDIDWVDLVRRLAATPGVAHVTVWRYEDYRAVFAQVMAVLLGAGAPPVSPVAHRVNRGLSAAAVAFIQEHRAIATEGPLWHLARETYPVGPDHPPHDGFSPKEKAASQKQYAAQWHAIGALPGVTRIRPATEQT
ncbi:hypothetical protein SAMN04488003_13414 [Loktanella fryxellensis]|uniref:Sulfotransferase family protein n=1 Tax=Loktanella fryxellensis TaxID=245187 RepID=A0A1H8J8H8_9RHOB|nr:hypothetical protein [Loktanella fryxellensis]SEN77062.1 hypothetical protein SAMN04488003_13414 [Loktanella fryxellensis]